MTTVYPLALRLDGRAVLVVGGGPVAARRAASLSEAGALVTVVAPQLCEDLEDQRDNGSVRHRARSFRETDVEGVWLVHSATGDRATDHAVAKAAEGQGTWCVRADDAAASAAWTPAVGTSDDVTIAVTSGDPGRSQRIRSAVLARLESGDLPVRAQRRKGQDGSRSTPGHVAIVGGGPGDAGLISTKGRRLLAQADVVVIDRLAPWKLVEDLDEDVEVIDVGKTPGHHPVPQNEINALLVRHARAGLRVVRLKGGDPYVLGRGAEEVLACREAGVEVSVVPGVTSAVSVLAAEGIPVTHRGLSTGFTVITGHDDADWPTLARLDHTLVALMGVSRLAETTAALIANGKDPRTPAAVVEDGYGPRQRRVLGTLSTIASKAAAVGVEPPAVVVIGDVAALAPQVRPAATGEAGVVLVAHGSRDPRAAEVNQRVAAGLQARLGTPVTVSQLDHDGPRPGEAVQAMLDGGLREVVAAPLLFTPAFHVTKDLPESLVNVRVPSQSNVHLAAALLPHPGVLDALDERLEEVWLGEPPPDGRVLACAGTADHAASLALSDFARSWGARHGVPATIGHASGPGQSIADAIASLRDRGCCRIAVGSLFTAPGYLHERAREQAIDSGATIIAPPIANAPGLIRALADRYESAMPH